jgi:hypothetical protein
VYAVFEVTEPLLLSPFVFGSGFGKQGFYGIQTMNFQMNIAPTANRAWRSAVYTGSKSVSVVEFNDSQLLFQFLTPHASDMLDPRNVVPFYELPIYRTSNLPTLPCRPDYGQVDDGGRFVEAPLVTLNSTNIQLNGIPDKLIIFVRKPIATLRCSDTDSYATIKNISMNFNNQEGLLSSMSPEQLFRNSVQSGLANMSWDEFNGSVISSHGLASNNAQVRSPFSGVGVYNIVDDPVATGVNPATPGIQYSPTTGTILVLNFAECIQLTEEYYAPGSLGAFNLQLTLQVQNNQYYGWPAGGYELIIIPMNSGVFVNERGTSSTFLSLLTKQDVLDSLQQQPYSLRDPQNGGRWLSGQRQVGPWMGQGQAAHGPRRIGAHSQPVCPNRSQRFENIGLRQGKQGDRQ